MPHICEAIINAWLYHVSVGDFDRAHEMLRCLEEHIARTA